MEFQVIIAQAKREAPSAYAEINLASNKYAAKGEWEESALAYRRAILKSNNKPKWIMRRYAISGFIDVMLNQLKEKKTATDEDLKLLQQIGHNKFDDEVYIRAEALKALGVMRWDRNDRPGAARAYRECLALEKPDIDVRVFTGVPTLHSSLALITKCQEDAQHNLNVLEGRMQKLPQHLWNHPPKSAVSTHGMSEELRVLYDRGMRLSSANECDECGHTSTEKLKTCSKCRSRFYCSAACQKKAYKRTPNGHRETCRAMNEFRVDDFAQIRGLSKRPELNGLIVRILPPEDTKDNHDKQLDLSKYERLHAMVIPSQNSVHIDNTFQVRPQNLVYISTELRFRDRDDSRIA